jgi:predicted RNase H-like nuclease (RuvC/YqgF family)
MTDELERRIAQAKRRAVQHRNYRRARDRALARLAHAYPDTYKELLAVERQFDEQQGKKWIDLDGSTNPVMDISTNTNTPSRETTQRFSSGSKTRNDGGEA